MPSSPLLTYVLPLRIVSEANLREHFRAKSRRVKRHRRTAWVHTLRAFGDSTAIAAALMFPVVVTMTRVAPRTLDDDNLASAFKATRDGIADALCDGDDRDPRVTWRVAQERGAAKVYAVRVEIARAL